MQPLPYKLSLVRIQEAVELIWDDWLLFFSVNASDLFDIVLISVKLDHDLAAQNETPIFRKDYSLKWVSLIE